MDISVPGFHNYIAHGFINHNCKVESKDDMRKRGVASPDFADALGMCFAPEGGFGAPEIIAVNWASSAQPHRDESAQRRRGYFGRQ